LVDFDAPDADAPAASASVVGYATARALPLAVAVTALPPPPPPAAAGSSSPSRGRLVAASPSLRPGCALAPRVGRVHVVGDGGVGKAALVAALVRSWPQALVAAEERAEGPKEVAAAATGAWGAGPGLGCLDASDGGGGSRLQGGGPGAGPLHVPRGFAPLPSRDAPLGCWVHRASVAPAAPAAAASAGASARGVARCARREAWAGGLRPLSLWADATVLVLVDLTLDRRKQHAALKRHLKLLQAAAPENATVMVEGCLSSWNAPLSSHRL
jgi:hypothetical protein